MVWQTILAIIGAITGSTGLFGFLQFMIKRNDDTSESYKALSKEIASVKDDIKSLKDDQDRVQAINARIRILNASDEMRHTQNLHSEEFFDQLNDDITLYENYCNTHPGFKNNKAAHAIKYLNEIYKTALLKNNFL